MYNLAQNINVLSFRVHTGNISICYRKRETFCNNINYFVKFSKANSVIIRKDTIYHFKDKVFMINNGRFIYKDTNIELPTKTIVTTAERLALSLGLPLNHMEINMFKINPTNFRDILHRLTTLALKDLQIISNNFNQSKQLKYGEIVFETYLKSIAGKGTISSNNTSIRWLNEEDTLQLKAKLFTTSNYQVTIKSMTYEPTEFAQKIFETVFTLIKSIDFEHNELKLMELDFVVPIDILIRIKLRDIMLLLSNCAGYNCGFIIRPVLQDKQYSRVYSVFTSLSSKTRKLLGFLNYDIGSALQTICLKLVENVSLYPLHKQLVDNKYAFRERVMRETNKDMAWVKKELSKVDNIDNMPKRYVKFPTLEGYYYEAKILRKEIINNAEPLLLSRAQEYAKPKYKKVWNEHLNEYDFELNGKKESSIFFFIWTQWERQIRESMMSRFDMPESCHQVHDAIYSKQVVEIQTIESKVLNDTGFEIKISVD